MTTKFNVDISDKNHIAVSGRIDSSNALAFESCLSAYISQKFDTLTIDAEKLSYISSAGLRVLIKLRRNAENTITIENTTDDVYQIFDMTGFSQLFKVKKGFRRLSVEGCPVIGTGFYGTVYRIDPDTIVKVFQPSCGMQQIEEEQKKAKAAFLKGIPTAISYDIVKVDDSYGLVFEMLKSESFNDLIIQHPEQIDENIKRWSDLLKKVHATTMDPGVLPSAKTIHLNYLEVVRDYLDDAQYNYLHAFLEKIPNRMTVVHGDYQMKNVMLSDDEPMLIDMETLAVGHPIFDMAGIYVTYQMFEEDEPGNTMAFYGIPASTCDYIWDKLLEYYLETNDAAIIQSETQKIKLIAAVRFLYILAISNLKEGPLGELRIRHTKEHIGELMNQMENL